MPGEDQAPKSELFDKYRRLARSGMEDRQGVLNKVSLMLSSWFIRHEEGPAQVDLYLRPDRTWVLPRRSPAQGVWIPAGPLKTLAAETPMARLASELSESMKQSGPTDWSEMALNPLMAELGESWNELFEKTLHLTLERQSGRIRVTPHRPLPDRFLPLPQRALWLPDRVRDWAPRLQEALRRCQRVDSFPREQPTSQGPLAFGPATRWLALQVELGEEPLQWLPLDLAYRVAWKRGIHQAAPGSGRGYLTPCLPHAPGWCLLLGDLPLQPEVWGPLLEPFARAQLWATSGAGGPCLFSWHQGELQQTSFAGDEQLFLEAARLSLDPSGLQPQSKRYASGYLVTFTGFQNCSSVGA